MWSVPDPEGHDPDPVEIGDWAPDSRGARPLCRLESPPASSYSRRPKVLIAEDGALTAMSMRGILSRLGIEAVGVAATVTNALCLAENTKLEAILDVRPAGRCTGS